ncbi:MAG: UDPGP type 1 family protein [candidate division KSB1 bacterium]|nr:UDPGP type 1 family protein [candidate division KSB1 bacterium]
MTPVRNDQARVFLDKVRAAGQGHVLRFWDNLPEGSRRQLLHQLTLIDFDFIAQLYRDFILHKQPDDASVLMPAETISLAHQQAHPQEVHQMIALGEEKLKAGQVAAVLVAGGQASRLGFTQPKGLYPIGPVSKKSLFQLHAEKLLAMARRYATRIPWYIMISETNAGATRNFFEQNKLFGYPAADIFFFEQEMVPALDENGKLILDAPDHIFMNPNGHGGTLTALKKSGALEDMRRRGIEEIFYFQVDNVLLKICDPLFIGYHVATGAEMSAKVCGKRDPHEKMGVVGRLVDPLSGQAGALKVIEYSDMSNADKEARLPDGTLKYNAGNLAIHLFKLDFITQEVWNGTKLPWHVAHKKIPYLDARGKLVQPDQPNGYKFETFIFDALSDAHQVVLLEVDRRVEFSAVKNAAGEDSPQTAQRDLCELYAAWLEKAGVKIPRESSGALATRIEISPLLALDAEELTQKIPPTLRIQQDIYLEP